MAEMNSAIGENSTVEMIRIRTDTVIPPGGQLALNRKPGELQVGAALNSGADEKAPMQQRAFRPHVIKRFVSL